MTKTAASYVCSLRVKALRLLFTNLSTGDTFLVKPNGIGNTIQYVQSRMGRKHEAATGHNVLIFFPTDVPAGPSTTAVRR